MMTTAHFRKTIRDYYRLHGRKLAWRYTRKPYRILISEIMLQQTQVSRVEGYYAEFLKQFPNFGLLAKARTGEVLRAWQGLGYNRRALALQKIAKIVIEQYGGKLPRDRKSLESLPGVGSYTAGAMRTFAFGESEIFIETNIRRVFIHFFFAKQKSVSDHEINRMIERTIDKKDPKSWYYALMDYGAMLGVTVKKNPNRRSARYAKQSKFSGSDRELRGKILRLLLEKKHISRQNLTDFFPAPKRKIEDIVAALGREGFIKASKNILTLA